MFPVGAAKKVPESVVQLVLELRRERLANNEILHRFSEPSDRRAAAIILSGLPDLVGQGSFRIAHIVLYTTLAVFFLAVLPANLSIDGFLYAAGIVVVIVFLRKRSPWGYSGAIGYAAWNMIWIGADTAEFTWTAEDLSIALVALILTGAMATIAIHLRKTLFPYMGIIGVKIGDSGEPLLLSELDNNEEPSV